MAKSETITFINQPATIKTVFVISLIFMFCWFLIAFVITDVYAITMVGVIYEMLWLPMLLGLFFLPLISLYQSLKVRFSLRSIPPYSLFINIVTILFVVVKEWSLN